MNLIQKIDYYIWLRTNKVRNAGRKAFASPLVTSDYYLITLAVCMALLCVILSLKTELDNITPVTQKKISEANKKYDYMKRDRDKAWTIVASMLNGRVKMDGRVRTIRIMRAGGDCE